MKAIIKLNAVVTAAAVKCFFNKVIELSQTAIFLSPHISNHYKSIDCAQKKINPIYFISSIEIDFLLKRLITSKYYVMTEVRSGGDDKLLGIQFDKFIPHTERGQETAEMTMRQLS